MAKAPPVPPDQQGDPLQGEGGTRDGTSEVKRDPAGGTSGVNLREQGRSANIDQNTRNKGHQQDR